MCIRDRYWYFLRSDLNVAWVFYRAQILVFEYAAMSNGVQIRSTYFAAIIKVWQDLGMRRYFLGPVLATCRYSTVLAGITQYVFR